MIIFNFDHLKVKISIYRFGIKINNKNIFFTRYLEIVYSDTKINEINKAVTTVRLISL